MTIKITGNWEKGAAYDYHSLKSNYIGVDDMGKKIYDTTRTEMGELVYQLKYQSQKSLAVKIVDLLESIKSIEKFDAIIPMPPTKITRDFQPVKEIALELGKRSHVKVLTDLLSKKEGEPQLKNVDNPDARKELLKDVFFLSGDQDISGQNVLLLDDLYDTGATLSEVTSLLYNKAKVKNVYVLTMTKTRRGT